MMHDERILGVCSNRLKGVLREIFIRDDQFMSHIFYLARSKAYQIENHSIKRALILTMRAGAGSL